MVGTGVTRVDAANGIALNECARHWCSPQNAVGKFAAALSFQEFSGLNYTGAALDLAATDSFSISLWAYPVDFSGYNVLDASTGPEQPQDLSAHAADDR